MTHPLEQVHAADRFLLIGDTSEDRFPDARRRELV